MRVRACVRACVCAYVRPSVHPSFFSKTTTGLSVKRGHVIKPENKTLERRDPGRLEKRTAAMVSMH